MNTTQQEQPSQHEKKPARNAQRKTRGVTLRPSSSKNEKKATEETSAPAHKQHPAASPKKKPSQKHRKSAQSKTESKSQVPVKAHPKSGAKGSAKGAPKLRVIPLGGLDGIGKNMTAFEYGDDMIVVDAGLMFPDDDHPGVDLILPDYSYIIENQHKLRAILITHGHEDHTGALPYLLKDLDAKVPVVATKLTLGLIKGKLDEHGLRNPKFHEVKAGDTY